MAGEGWTRMPLGEFVTLQRGHDLPDERRRPGSVPILGSFGITGWHDKARACAPGVTVGRSGASFGVVTYSPVDFWPLNTALYVTDFHGNDERFAYYFLKLFDFQSYNSGSAQPSLNRNFVHPVPVDVPPFPEQRAIAQILGTLDDKIELNRQMNKTLEAMARTLFKSRFVDFDRTDGTDGRDGLVEELLTLSRDTINPSSCPDESFEHYSIPAFDEGREPKVEMGDDIKSNKFLVPQNSVLLSKLNPRFPRVWLPTLSDTGRSVCSTEFLAAIPREGVSREYLYGLFASSDFSEVFSSLVTGTSGSHQRVKPDYLLAMEVVIPPRDIIRRYTDFAKPLHERIALNSKECRTLAVLRDTLLPKLISGELRVRDRSRIVEVSQ